MNIEKTLIEGATYAGHPFHIILNYTVLLLVLIPNIFGVGDNKRAWLLLFVAFIVIQISFWFLMGAVGISLIWCALAGYNSLILFIYRKQGIVTVILLLISPLTALAAVVFYAIYFPIPTSIAHIIAFLLGIPLGLRFRRRFKTSYNK